MADSQYAYFTCGEVLYRVEIPTSREQEFKIEIVFSNLPLYPGLFNHGHTVYVVGGQEGDAFEYTRRMYIFDPSRFHKLPIENLDCLDKSRNFESMVEPRVIRGAEDRIYFLSVNSEFYQPLVDREPLCFQSFDPIKDCFQTLPSPTLPTDHVIGPNVIFGHFFLSGYIYLLIRDPWNAKYPNNVFTFNIKLSKWEERMPLLDRFKKKQIPLPFGHNGDIGLSDEFSDNTRILVAFHATDLCAYCVKIHADGDIEPISYRVLDESCYRYDFRTRRTRLADIGGGRFCVVTGSYNVDLLMYVFKIDFALEHQIQITSSVVGASSLILYSKKFQLGDVIGGFCMVSAPPTASKDQNSDDDRKIGEHK